MTIPNRTWAEIALLSLLWGGSFLGFSLALRELGVFTTVAFRIAGGSVLLWAYIFARGLTIPRNPKIWGAFLVMGTLNNAIPFSLIAWGQLNISSGLAAILNASTAVFGILIAAMVFSDERLTSNKLFGVTLGFLGVATAIGLSALTEFNLTSLAQLAIIGSSISYGLASAWARKTMKGLTPQVSAAGMTLCGALIMVPLALYIDGVPTLDYMPSTWAALAHLAILATALAYLLYYRVLAVAGAGNAMLITLTVAPIAIVLGALILGEELKPQAYLGFALLALGLLVIDGRLIKKLMKR